MFVSCRSELKLPKVMVKSIRYNDKLIDSISSLRQQQNRYIPTKLNDYFITLESCPKVTL